MDAKNIGLRNVTVADTKISNIDGEHGKLIYRGYDIMDLVKSSTFEEVSYLLLHNELPTKKELGDFHTMLTNAREIPASMIKNMDNFRKDSHPMDLLQAFTAELGGYYVEHGTPKEINYDMAINLLAKMPTMIACWDRVRRGESIVAPDHSLSHSANFLYMMSGTKPDPEVEKILDTCLILHADHSFNASTFAAREVASTRAHMYSAISAAIGALSGQLHGGANYEVMKMLLEIGTIDKVETWVKERLANKDRVMGMGHAVYKTYDPRATVLKELSEKLAAKTGDPWFSITQKIEEVTISEMKKLKGMDIYPNVDLYSASLYYMLKIPKDLNTPIFAISRVAGWASHVTEESFAEAAPKAALYRPNADYVGKYCGPEGCVYKPIENRED